MSVNKRQIILSVCLVFAIALTIIPTILQAVGIWQYGPQLDQKTRKELQLYSDYVKQVKKDLEVMKVDKVKGILALKATVAKAPSQGVVPMKGIPQVPTEGEEVLLRYYLDGPATIEQEAYLEYCQKNFPLERAYLELYRKNHRFDSNIKDTETTRP